MKVREKVKITSMLWKLPLLLAMVFFCNQYTIGQGGSSEKAKARISLSLVNDMDAGATLVARVLTKVEKSYEPVEGTVIFFYIDSVSEESQLGRSITDGRGESSLTIPRDHRFYDSPIWTTFYATIENDERFKDADTDLEIKRSRLTMNLVLSDDSEKFVEVKLTEFDSVMTEIPVPDVGVRIFVKRMFGNLPVNGPYDATDENGELSIAFPEDIPGNTDGMLTVIARIDDHDEFGTLIAKEEQNWGIPLVIDPDKQKSRLWSSRSNVPIYLLVICNGLIIGIWGTIIYLISQIFRIKRLGRNLDQRPA